MIDIVSKRFREFLRDDDGPTAVEYAVMVAMIAVAVIASVGQVATATKNSFDSSGTSVNSALNP